MNVCREKQRWFSLVTVSPVAVGLCVCVQAVGLCVCLLLGLSLTQLWHRPGTTEEFLKRPSKSRARKGDKLTSHKRSVTAATTAMPLLPKGVFAKVAEEKEHLGREGGRGRPKDKAVTS